MTDGTYGYDRFPKARYACPECDREVVVAGHEYEAVFCCGDTEMDWVGAV